MAVVRDLGRLRAGIFPRLLIALLLVSLLPLTAFWQLERQRMLQNGEADARQRLGLFADLAVQRVDAWVQFNLSILDMAASQRAMRSMRPAAQRRAIEALKSRLPWAYLIHTIGLNGSNVVRSDGRPPLWYGDRGYFRRILSGRPYAVEVQIGRTSHRPALLLSVPIRGLHGHLAGLLVEAATLDHVTQAVTSETLGRTGHALLMTRKGRLIADRGIPMQLRLRDVATRPVFAAAQRGAGFYSYTYRGNEKVAEVRETRFGWILVAQQQQVENLAAVHQANRYAWLLLGVTAAAVTVISAFVARFLAAWIGQVTRALEAAKTEAERANRSKTSLVAAAVHDLMQPLNAARMFAGTVRSRLQRPADRELLDGIDSALEAEDAILSSVLDISRLESGTFEVNARPFPLGALLETLGREFGIVARARGIELRVARCHAVIRSDEALLRRILQNFLSNAIRYTNRGRVLMGCRRCGAALRIEVWDTGPGIAPEHRQKIFLEFQRLDTAAAERGAGLGLAIVERIGKRLGHRIDLRSWVGRGSVFSVEVPRERVIGAGEAAAGRPASAGEQLDAADGRSAPLAGARVWTVEDDPQAAEGLRALLTEWGCEVVSARSGAEALSLAQTQRLAPDLLLLDYRLPDGPGPEFAPQLLRCWGSAEVPVMIVTAERDAALREQMVSRGWGFLAKPVSPAKLRAAVTYVLMRGAAT